MPRFLLIAILVICSALLFGNSAPAATRVFCASYISHDAAQVKTTHCRHTDNHTVNMGTRRVKPVNRRVKALNADLDSAPQEIVFTSHIAHTEKVKAYILSTRFFSHRCGKLTLRGPPQLA